MFATPIRRFLAAALLAAGLTAGLVTTPAQAARGCDKVGTASLYLDGVRAATVNDYDCGLTEYAQVWVWKSFMDSHPQTWSASVYVQRQSGQQLNRRSYSNVRQQDMPSSNLPVIPPSAACGTFSYGGRSATVCTPYV
ncbi:hypothetical protein GCM10022419_071430 [Nonomuraea rosea]|uniref:Secreted protein n=1 Tax=Nonomuraea rosea TaxID=638574 RepID=A0ABP6Y9Y0_9ACTN